MMYILFGIGCYLIIMALISNVNAYWYNKLFFKIIPFFSGLFLLYYTEIVNKLFQGW